MTELLHKKLTGTIIGVYYDVYNGTARTYPEFIYERAMTDDLRRKGVSCRRQPDYQVFYKDKLVGVQQLDLFVAEDVVVEIKAVPQLTRLHKAQAISYLKVVDKEVGLLCNFGSPSPEFERLYFTARSAQNERGTTPLLQTDWPAEFLSPELTHTVIGGLYEVHSILGPGFIHRIYANAAYHELSLRDLEVRPRREYHVYTIPTQVINYFSIRDGWIGRAVTRDVGAPLNDMRRHMIKTTNRVIQALETMPGRHCASGWRF